MAQNFQIVLDSRPQGEAQASNFKIVNCDTPSLQDGQVLVRHHFLSLDPYMRGRMNDNKSYAQPQAIGEVMIGGTVGEVVESRHPKFKAGDTVVGMGGWQNYSVVDGNAMGALRKVNTTQVPMSHYLGAVGMPGVTAWYGLVKIIAPKAGETLTVSAASGAVGSAFGALAKARGCRVVGIAGGKEKCDYVVKELGFDECIDYKEHADYISLSKALKLACPKGIDGHFENVGGMVLDAVMLRSNAFSRIAVCGMIAGYNDPNGAAVHNLMMAVGKSIRLQGFIVSNHFAEYGPAFQRDMVGWIASGQIKWQETVEHGIDNAVGAFLKLFSGENTGKMLVKLT